MPGNYPNVAALNSAAVHSDLVDFDFAEVKIANNLFKLVVRDAKYDLAELGILTIAAGIRSRVRGIALTFPTTTKADVTFRIADLTNPILQRLGGGIHVPGSYANVDVWDHRRCEQRTWGGIGCTSAGRPE
jgi:hypothetical protein